MLLTDRTAQWTCLPSRRDLCRTWTQPLPTDYATPDGQAWWTDPSWAVTDCPCPVQPWHGLGPWTVGSRLDAQFWPLVVAARHVVCTDMRGWIMAKAQTLPSPSYCAHAVIMT